MVYDTDLNITWVADANLFKTQAAGNSNLVNEIIANPGVDVYGDDLSLYLSNTDFDTTTGQMSDAGAQAWVNSLNYGGYDDWRLPSLVVGEVFDVNGYYQWIDSDLSSLFYRLGGVFNTSITATHNADFNLFSNIQTNYYWARNVSWCYQCGNGNNSQAVEADPHFYPGGYMFSGGDYGKSYAWAVRDGDVAAVPVPAAAWLFGSGLLGLLSLKRRRNFG